jgi:hypothetical protein
VIDRRSFVGLAAGAALGGVGGARPLEAAAIGVRTVCDVRDFGVRGDGQDDGAAIAAAMEAAVAARGVLLFPAGTYAYERAINFARTGLRIVGQGQVTLRHTGTGVGGLVDGSTLPEGQAWDMHLEHLCLQGGPATTIGFLLRAVHHSRFVNLRVTGAATGGQGFRTEFFVANYCEGWRVTLNEANGTVPDCGIALAALGGAESTLATVDSTFMNCVCEGCGRAGMHLERADHNLIRGGTFENSRTGTGLVIGPDSTGNLIDGVYLEDNAVCVDCRGPATHFHAVRSAGAETRLGPGADGCRFYAGYYSSLAIAPTVRDTLLVGAALGHVDDQGAGTQRAGCRDLRAESALPDLVPQGIRQRPWQPAALNPPWRDVGGGTNPASYMRDTNGFVRLRGYLRGNGAAPAVLFVLPAGFRPPYRERFPVLSEGRLGLVEVHTDGRVVLAEGSATDVTLDGIAFGDGSF